MSFERKGNFVEFIGEDGIRHLARISAIQIASDVDEMKSESYVTVAGRMMLVRSSLDEIRDALLNDRPIWAD